MSEMFIPTSVWEQSLNLQYGVFEILDASTILEMMKDIFMQKVGIQNNFLMDPFSVRIFYGFRNSFDPNIDDYKYRVALEYDKVKFNFRPNTLVDIMLFQEYIEGVSYMRDLARYRPLIRI